MTRKPDTRDEAVALTIMARLLLFWTICAAALATFFYKLTKWRWLGRDIMALIDRMNRAGILTWRGQIWLVWQKHQLGMLDPDTEGGKG